MQQHAQHLSLGPGSSKWWRHTSVAAEQHLPLHLPAVPKGPAGCQAGQRISMKWPSCRMSSQFRPCLRSRSRGFGDTLGDAKVRQRGG